MRPQTPVYVSELAISVVLFHSHLAHLVALVRSIIEAVAQTDLKQVDLILVDQSLDAEYSRKSRNACEEFNGVQAVQIQYVQTDDNRGYGAGHNLALKRVTSQIHLFLNPDVELDRRSLQVSLDILSAHGALGLLAPIGFNGDGKPQFLARSYPSVWILALRGLGPHWLKKMFRSHLARYELRAQPSSEKLKCICLASGCCMWVRRSVLDQIGGFNEKYFLYFEDYDLSLRIAEKGFVAEHSDLKITHHGGNTSKKGFKHTFWFLNSAIMFFNRWGWQWFGLK